MEPILDFFLAHPDEFVRRIQQGYVLKLERVESIDVAD